MANKVHVKTGDTVIMLTGPFEDKYKFKKDKEGRVIEGSKELRTGKVIAVSAEEGKVIVEGMHVSSKHKKPRKQGEAGGIVKVSTAMYASKVQMYCPKCDCGVRVRNTVNSDGKKARTCAKCGNQF